MSATTIAWTERSWNPIAAFDKETGKRGWFCVRVSPGCVNCYAAARNRWIGNHHDYRVPEAQHVELRLVPKQLHEPPHWRKASRVFVCSMTDLFYDGHTDEMIDGVFDVMRDEIRHTYQVLTKRPERMREYIIARFGRREGCPPHIWLGISAEDQTRFAERWPSLRDTPAAVRWISYEPALGHVVLSDDVAGQLHWLVVGGESGPGARPFNVEWARSIVDQCRRLNVAPFVKQLGALPGFTLEDEERRGNVAPAFHHFDDKAELFIKRMDDAKGENPAEWPAELRVREYPTVAA